MAKLLFIGTSGSSDPTQAVMPLVMARGALEAGHEAKIFAELLASHDRSASF